MESKLFEIRDRGTFIPAVGILMRPYSPDMADAATRLLQAATVAIPLEDDEEAAEAQEALRLHQASIPLVIEAERYLMRRAGHGYCPPWCVLLCKLSAKGLADDASYDCYSWVELGRRTMAQAHLYIEGHWDELQSGAVIDVEFILGETAECKRSEAFEFPGS